MKRFSILKVGIPIFAIAIIAMVARTDAGIRPITRKANCSGTQAVAVNNCHGARAIPVQTAQVVAAPQVQYQAVQVPVTTMQTVMQPVAVTQTVALTTPVCAMEVACKTGRVGLAQKRAAAKEARAAKRAAKRAPCCTPALGITALMGQPAMASVMTTAMQACLPMQPSIQPNMQPQYPAPSPSPDPEMGLPPLPRAPSLQ